MLSSWLLQRGADRSFALSEIAAAQAYLEADKHVGKVVVRI
jgi:NADPH:quinone reductase-like Zn-dependent oxidoreductase